MCVARGGEVDEEGKEAGQIRDSYTRVLAEKIELKYRFTVVNKDTLLRGQGHRFYVMHKQEEEKWRVQG